MKWLQNSSQESTGWAWGQNHWFSCLINYEQDFLLFNRQLIAIYNLHADGEKVNGNFNENKMINSSFKFWGANAPHIVLTELLKF